MKILITGGAGFIGSSLAEGLLKDPTNKLLLLDNLSTGRQRNLPAMHRDRYIFINCDINRFEDLSPAFLNFSPDVVFHYAAVVGVQRTLKHPLSVLQDLDGINNILRLSKNTAVHRVYFSSSSEVYGEPVSFPQNEETTPLNSRLPYAVVKNAGESFLKAYFQEYGLNYTIFRFFNTFGPKQSSDFVISKFVDQAVKNQPITINGDGRQTRTFCYIDDNVKATITSLKTNQFLNQTVNIGSDQEITINSLAQLVIKLTGSHSQTQYLPALKEGDMTRRLPDITNMRQLLGRSPISLKRGLEKILLDKAN